MRLETLSLYQFRNYREAEIGFSEGIHILFGENGAGKTSILEAIYYLALTRSFRTAVDRHLIHNQGDLFRIQDTFSSPQGQRLQTAIAYSAETGKRLTVNGQRAHRFSEYIGDVPAVLLHPADLSLSQGGPQQRRRFLDVLLSQSSRLYLHHLIQYNRSLRQRNQMLQQERVDPQVMSAWEESLVTHGAELVRRRSEAVGRLEELVAHYYRQLSNRDTAVTARYRSNVRPDGEETLEAAYRRLLDQRRRRERDYGSTIVGPHRDDLDFSLAGRAMKDYASQGEHKTLVIALKLAEYHFLQERHNQAPILLFDDIFGELDAGRIQLMLAQLSDIGQVFVTTTSRNFFDKVHTVAAPTRYFQVAAGTIRPVAAANGA